MILVTVGTQLPFPRLTDAVARWARDAGERTVIQSGAPGGGAADGVEIRQSIPPGEFERLFADARVVVGHAGIGTILTAQRIGRPLVLMPRKAALGEHRNDHQVATARHVAGRPGLYVAEDEAALAALLGRDDLEPARPGAGEARAALIRRVGDFLAGAG